MKSLIDKLVLKEDLPKEKLKFLLENLNSESKKYLLKKADEIRRNAYGDKVFMRGLIEISSYCERNCIYCGIRKDNKKAQRYRLTEEDIVMCCDEGYRLGYRTFVLQGGEDSYFTDEKIVTFVHAIKKKYPDTRVTLSLGEKSRESYEAYFKAGADRYLLRHETASRELYRKLHPDMSYENRVRCLYNLKDIGYQVGAGFMIGIPGQKIDDFVMDLKFLKILEPHMIGIGPFIPHKDTPFKNFPHGTLEMTETLLAFIRIMLPDVLLPATTALGSIDVKGRERGLKAGANVVMPNLSPVEVREKYSLYDGKICTGDEAAHCRNCIEGRINFAGYKVDMSVGDNFLWRDRR
jgi:biotin synthase